MTQIANRVSVAGHAETSRATKDGAHSVEWNVAESGSAKDLRRAKGRRWQMTSSSAVLGSFSENSHVVKYRITPHF